MSSRTALGSAVLAAASVLAVLVVVELALRVLGPGTGGELSVRRIVAPDGSRVLDCYPSNPRGYFDLDLREPGNDSRYRRLAPHRYDAIARDHRWAVEIRYNALRFRDVAPEPKPTGVRRVVVFGDSFVEGQGVKADDTLARALERLLDARAPGRFEVRNCGRRGLDFPELLASFEQALAYEPDLLIYALTLNDAEKPRAFAERQSFVNDWILDRTRAPDEEPAPPSRLRPRLFDFVAERLEALRVGRETTRWYRDMWSERNPGFSATQEDLRGMQRRLGAREARLLVAPWPLFVALERGYPFGEAHAAIGRFCLAAGIAHHDLLPSFAGRSTEALWVHPVDHHPNERAHALAAESLVPAVLELVELSR